MWRLKKLAEYFCVLLALCFALVHPDVVALRWSFSILYSHHRSIGPWEPEAHMSYAIIASAAGFYSPLLVVLGFLKVMFARLFSLDPIVLSHVWLLRLARC